MTITGKGDKETLVNMKIPLELIPPQFMQDIARVLLFGASKYAKHNWMQGISFETILGGVQRHVQAFRSGEEFDPETGLPHIAHAACGLMFMHWYAHGPDTKQYRELVDDRVFKDVTSAYFRNLGIEGFNFAGITLDDSPYLDG